MRRLQCKYCNKYGGETGRIISKEVVEDYLLPGHTLTCRVRIYTVECSSCHHKWQYRKKIK